MNEIVKVAWDAANDAGFEMDPMWRMVLVLFDDEDWMDVFIRGIAELERAPEWPQFRIQCLAEYQRDNPCLLDAPSYRRQIRLANEVIPPEGSIAARHRDWILGLSEEEYAAWTEPYPGMDTPVVRMDPTHAPHLVMYESFDTESVTRRMWVASVTFTSGDSSATAWLPYVG